MANGTDGLSFFDEFISYAQDIAEDQIEQAEMDMQLHPDSYTEYTETSAWLEDEEVKLIQKLGGDAMATEGFRNAFNAKCAALAIEVYKRGVLDGGRIHHAFVTRELPKGGKPDA